MVISELDAAHEVALVKDGRSQRYIVQVLEISQSCVRRNWSRFLKTDSYCQPPGKVLHRCTSARGDYFFTLSMLQNWSLTAIKVINRLVKIRDVHLSKRIIRRRWNATGLMARRPAHSCTYQANRLTFAELYCFLENLFFFV